MKYRLSDKMLRLTRDLWAVSTTDRPINPRLVHAMAVELLTARKKLAKISDDAKESDDGE